jgi:hypothetical protein
MTADPALLSALADAIRNAGATEGIVAALLHAGGTFEHVPRSKGGRPRKYADRAECDRAYRKRRKAREETREETDRAERRAARLGEETREETAPAQVRREETPRHIESAEYLRTRLIDAAHGNFDLSSSIEPIRTLLDQGCDLEADVVPIVARLLPDLPRPLKNWGAPWLVREILAAREQRLARHRVEAPPLTRRTPAIEWDELVEGHRTGLIQWNRARLGPCPGEPGCRAPTEVLREHGYRP